MNITIWCPLTFSNAGSLQVWLESLSRRLSSSEVQTRTCGPAGRDDGVWPVLPDHETCLGHAGVHTADEFVHPAGLHRLHCAMCLLAIAMMLRRRRTQAEAPGLAGVTWLVSLNHRKRWIAAWGQRVHPLPIPCVERVLPATLKRHGSSGRARLYGTFLYKMVPGVSSLRLPSLARRRGRPRKHGLTTYKSKRSRAN